jgi:ElaB/YqjD/DUF883 family membrane-anchored ribosome-binding protein
MTKPRQQSRVREVVRQFRENGMKMLLEHPANVRDLLSLLHATWLDEIDFGRMEQIKTTFIRRDYRHLESDMVLTAPLAGARTRKRGPKNLLIYVLIEHQSRPDRLIPLRVADSQLQIFRYQVRQWSRTHRSLARVRLMPVLPVVFYTGLRRWPQLGTLADLVERGDEFRLVTPIVERPLFLNLPELDAVSLERDGGYFGWVLRLIQQRRSRPDEFLALLERVSAHLVAMPPDERQRWRDLLSYIGAMVYHDRDESEHAELQEALERSMENEELREEVIEMGKSMADVLMERGWTEGWTKAEVKTRQETLVRQLRKRFGKVPRGVVRAVESTADVAKLDDWLDRFATADKLDDLGIPSK